MEYSKKKMRRFLMLSKATLISTNKLFKNKSTFLYLMQNQGWDRAVRLHVQIMKGVSTKLNVLNSGMY